MQSTIEEMEPNKGKDIDSLKLAKVKQQKQELIERIEKIETQLEDSETTYRWCLLSLLQLIPPNGNGGNGAFIEAFERLLKTGAPQDALKSFLLRVKDVSAKQEMNKPEIRPTDVKAPEDLSKKRASTPSLLNWFRKLDKISPQQPPGFDLGPIKSAYIEIIGELRLNLNEDALNELMAIEKKLHETTDIEGLLFIRKPILDLLRKYISRISKEREDAAAFIREIGERLIEVEGHMVSSLTFAKDAHQVNSSFTDTLEAQLADFKHSIDSSRDLSELKTAVVTRLFSIKSVLENKRQNDSVRIKQADQQLQKLQQNLSEMKSEIEAAWQRAQNLEQELLIDPLTGIYNRRAYDKRIEEEIQRYQRYQRTFSLLVIDVDHFKQVNDHYGHTVGDMCLKEIINRIKSVLRKSDFLSRFGGEEFAIILPETNVDRARDVAEKLRYIIETTKFIHKTDTVVITVSLGVTEVSPSDKTPEDIFSRADKALYTAKQTGRNKVMAG